MSTPPVPARVFGYVAAEADVCVLLRRGPSRQVLMVRWDLATDKFEIGQWLKARVYEGRCDLSRDGCLFVYQANDGRYQSDHTGVYSAVCRPPYFTALALWAQGTTYHPGLQWSRPPRSFLVKRPPPPTIGSLPSRYSIFLRDENPWKGVPQENWSIVSDDATTVLARDSLAGEVKWYQSRSGFASSFWVGNRLLDVDWVDVDHRGRLLFAREGHIYVHDTDGERELIDLNPLTFRSLAPPEWATRWP